MAHERDRSGAGHRHERLERVVREELEELLRDEATDPALAGVAIRHVALSVDYRHARVYFTCIDRRAAEAGLARAAGFLRSRLADAVELKRVPELRFVFDAAGPNAPDGGAA